MTLEIIKILNDEELMKSIDKSLKDVKENKVLTYREMLKELNIDEKEI